MHGNHASKSSQMLMWLVGSMLSDQDLLLACIYSNSTYRSLRLLAAKTDHSHRRGILVLRRDHIPPLFSQSPRSDESRGCLV